MCYTGSIEKERKKMLGTNEMFNKYNSNNLCVKRIVFYIEHILVLQSDYQLLKENKLVPSIVWEHWPDIPE